MLHIASEIKNPNSITDRSLGRIQLSSLAPGESLRFRKTVSSRKADSGLPRLSAFLEVFSVIETNF